MFVSIGRLGQGSGRLWRCRLLGFRVDSKTYQRFRVRGSGARVQSLGLRSKAQQRLHVGKGRDI